MTTHMGSIRQALMNFIEDQDHGPAAETPLSRDRGAAKVIVTPSGLSEDVHAVVYIPDFDGMGYGARQRMVWGYLKRTLPLEELKHLSLLRTVSSAEWDELPGLPSQEWLTTVSSAS